MRLTSNQRGNSYWAVIFGTIHRRKVQTAPMWTKKQKYARQHLFFIHFFLALCIWLSHSTDLIALNLKYQQRGIAMTSHLCWIIMAENKNNRSEHCQWNWTLLALSCIDNGEAAAVVAFRLVILGRQQTLRLDLEYFDSAKSEQKTIIISSNSNNNNADDDNAVTRQSTAYIKTHHKIQSYQHNAVRCTQTRGNFKKSNIFIWGHLKFDTPTHEPSIGKKNKFRFTQISCIILSTAK